MEYIWKILAIAVVCIAVAVLLSAIGTIIWTVVKAIKNKDFTRLIAAVSSVLCILFAAASWIFNFGWFRFFLTFLGIPVIHAAAFFFINNFAATYTNKSCILKIAVIISHITYLLGYFSLPDGGDIGPMYAFFTLIRDDALTGICFTIAGFGFFINAVCLVFELVWSMTLKSQNTKLKKATATNEAK